jgi:hypothetical protein
VVTANFKDDEVTDTGFGTGVIIDPTGYRCRESSTASLTTGPDQFLAPQINCNYPCGACDRDFLLAPSDNLMSQQQVRQRISAGYN